MSPCDGVPGQLYGGVDLCWWGFLLLRACVGGYGGWLRTGSRAWLQGKGRD